MLFEKLFRNGKDLVKKGELGVATRKAKIKISSSLNETESKIYDLLETQKEMLSNMSTFNHIEFGKTEKELADFYDSIKILADMYERLFDEKYEISVPSDVWEYFKEAVESKKEEK